MPTQRGRNRSQVECSYLIFQFKKQSNAFSFLLRHHLMTMTTSAWPGSVSAARRWPRPNHRDRQTWARQKRRRNSSRNRIDWNRWCHRIWSNTINTHVNAASLSACHRIETLYSFILLLLTLLQSVAINKHKLSFSHSSNFYFSSTSCTLFSLYFTQSSTS